MIWYQSAIDEHESVTSFTTGEMVDPERFELSKFCLQSRRHRPLERWAQKNQFHSPELFACKSLITSFNKVLVILQ